MSHGACLQIWTGPACCTKACEYMDARDKRLLFYYITRQCAFTTKCVKTLYM